MIQKISLLLVGCIISMLTMAQSTDDIQTPKIVPPSPDAAALGKYGEIPVDKSTGVPSISIPLYEIKTPKFSLPISLSYHASGIKVEEIPGWAGSGWALNAGGVITRSIEGFPDDGGLGYLTNHGSVKHADSIQWPRDILYISQVVTHQLDLQPDNFYYNFGNHSGAFIFGDDTKPLLIPYAPIKINFDQPSKNFNVTDEEGNFYSFTTKENVTSSIADMSGISSWYLTQMVSADLSDTIKFVYNTDSDTTNEIAYNFSQEVSGCPGSGSLPYLHSMVTTTSNRSYIAVRISSIQFKGGKVDFIAKSGRLDRGTLSLDSVIVSNLNTATGQYTRLKNFKLLTGYTYSTLLPPPTITLTEPDKYRLILTGLTENDGNNAPVETHHFDYNTDTLPATFSYAQDNWGYYNGQIGNQSLLQSQTITTKQDGLVNVGGSEGANRSVSPTHVQAGVLQKITYPTKGFTVFNYENNKQEGTQYDSATNLSGAVGLHLEHDTVIYAPTDNMLITGGNFFHIKLRRGNDNPTKPLPFVKIVRVADGHLMDSLASSPTLNTDTMIIMTLPLPASLIVDTPVRYQLISVAVGGNSPTSDSLPYASISTTYLAPTGSNLINIGGLRIQSISNYNADSTLLSTETYQYGNHDQSGGGIQLSFSMLNVYTHEIACDLTGTTGTLGLQTAYSNTSYYPMQSLNGSPIGYPTVTVYHGDLVHNTGKTVYTYNIFPDSLLICSGAFGNGVKPIPVTWKNGEPVEEDEYRNKGNGQYALLQAKGTNYTLLTKGRGTGTMILYTPEVIGNSNSCGVFVGPIINPTDGQVYICYIGPWFPSYFAWFDYPITAGVRLQTSTSITDYDTTGTVAVLSQTTNYYYDDSTLFLPTRTVTSDSKGHLVENRTYRPLDKTTINSLTTLSAGASAAIDSMVARNILTPVIQQVQYYKGNFNELALTNYNNWSSSLIAPQTIQTQLASNPLETRLQFNSYDGKGNPLELQRASDVKEVYLWGYHGQYPVAKVIGTTYAVASTYITQSILDNPPNDSTLRSQLNNLRSISGALVTTYTYKPLVGITSVTDPQGKTSFYEYDAFNRLKDIKDLNGNMIKTYDYHYAQ